MQFAILLKSALYTNNRFQIQMIVLPRQARDKHSMIGKVEGKLRGVFSQAVRDAKARAAREKASMVAKWKREPLDLEQFNGTRRLLLRFVCVCACGGDVSAGFGSTKEKKERKKRVQSLAKTGLGHRHVDNSWNEKKTAGFFPLLPPVRRASELLGWV
jgi:hypothetical protein